MLSSARRRCGDYRTYHHRTTVWHLPIPDDLMDERSDLSRETTTRGYPAPKSPPRVLVITTPVATRLVAGRQSTNFPLATTLLREVRRRREDTLFANLGQANHLSSCLTSNSAARTGSAKISLTAFSMRCDCEPLIKTTSPGSTTRSK